jgi:hypothetical protein
MWRGSHDTIVDGNTFVNCQREIAFGLEDIAGTSIPAASSKTISFIATRGYPGMRNHSVGCALCAGASQLDSDIRHVPNAVEYRFPDTAGVLIANNLTDGAIASRRGRNRHADEQFDRRDGLAFRQPVGWRLHLAITATARLTQRFLLRALPPTGTESRARRLPLTWVRTRQQLRQRRGTRHPTGRSYLLHRTSSTDSGAAWTIGSAATILRNGQPTSGFGSTIRVEEPHDQRAWHGQRTGGRGRSRVGSNVGPANSNAVTVIHLARGTEVSYKRQSNHRQQRGGSGQSAATW